ncbi:MAG: tRNA 4-thiouridine(8) synthase ThiI [SAR86 cluster bacterium]|uniref:tRNA sulfurtransferase n=1 Tax=SAR86 cluster bacterium TaxID=2030880 RepID=A0A2A5AX09_9GAMM|nr:MAG: tRNA 4-thiouridine(8) synthase ThiI [SAR86 cluster bacterium]
MLFLVKLFPEITIKTRPVRRRFIRQLRKNIKSVLVEFDAEISVSGEWDSIEVLSSVTDQIVLAQMSERLACTPGIAKFLEVEKFPLPDMDGILQYALEFYADKLTGKTFAVRCKRNGRHAFKSMDVERFVGGGLNQQTQAAGVKLVKPDVTVALEIRDDSLYVVRQERAGLGGFPLGCQDSVLSLISGGFDSSVSSYLCIKRGLQTHYCFFNLGGREHELAVKEVALFLWMKYHSSHRVKFISVPFENVIEEILTKVDGSQMGVVLKRMMLRAAAKVADSLHIAALVTGESVAQVSSQTLPNLAVIDSVSDGLILRPLATANKQEIIDIARQIGTEEFSKDIPEYCAVISNKPTTRARIHRIEREESRFDFSVLDDSIKNAKHQLITHVIGDLEKDKVEIEITGIVDAQSTVIDIRHPTETEIKPLNLGSASNGAEVLSIPFYQLRSSFDELDRSRRYLLYCGKGMMSRLHAANLCDEGFENVAVLDLSKS